jgi:hypothetical protein
MGLTDDIVKLLRTVFACKNQISHAGGAFNPCLLMRASSLSLTASGNTGICRGLSLQAGGSRR